MAKIPELMRSYNITPKQYFVLEEFSRADATAKELGKIMSLSAITVHQHIAALRRCLSVRTNVGLVVKAHKLGIIDLNEDE